MSVRMTDAEVGEFLASRHTGVLATLRADGSPALVPLWYVVLDDSGFVRTLARSAKVGHMRRDPRVSFLVEAGRAWAELQAVVIHGDAVIEGDPALVSRVDNAFAQKYAAYRMPSTASDRTRSHYAQERVHIRIVASRRTLTWDNAKIAAKG